jgi:type IV secretion system protein VirB5
MRRTQVWGLLAAMLLSVTPLARAQFAVIDVASLTQLVQQAQTLAQQLAAARQQVVQAQSLFASMSGTRGMQSLLSGVTRNYLPTQWTQLMGLLQGGGGGYSELSNAVQAMIGGNAVLSAAQLASLSSGGQSQITANRQAVALLQGVVQQALVNASGRFASLQQLINAIPTATDNKGILDLQARIAAEQGMLQNEQTKLEVLYQAALSEQRAASEQEREQVIVEHGRFATRFEPSPY